MRYRQALPIFALLLSTLSARADDTAKIAKVERFFKLAKLDQISTQIMQQVMEQTKSGMMQQLLGAKLTDDQQQIFNEFTDKVGKLVSGAVGWDALEPEYAKLYADAYTDQQLDDIIAFYSSPTGQAMVEKSPELIRTAGAISKERLTNVAPELQNLMREYSLKIVAKAPAQDKKNE